MKARLLQCLALLLVCSPAFASMPPKGYDHPYAGKLPKHRVAYGNAYAMCDKISMRRFGTHYPMSFAMIDGRKLYGCTIKNKDGTKPEIVYSYDPTGKDPKMEDNTFRHERGHANGWPSNHPNALP